MGPHTLPLSEPLLKAPQDSRLHTEHQRPTSALATALSKPERVELTQEGIELCVRFQTLLDALPWPQQDVEWRCYHEAHPYGNYKLKSEVHKPSKTERHWLCNPINNKPLWVVAVEHPSPKDVTFEDDEF